MSDDPAALRGRSPFRLNLEQQRKRARELLDGLRAGDAEARRRFQRHHPALSGRLDRPARLSQAHFVIARELGLPSWPRLQAHIRSMQHSRARIVQGEPAPDGTMATLHVRCGFDIATTLRQAGFIGDFLEVSDPLCQGPVRDDPGWLEQRADFLYWSYGADSGMSRAELAADLHLAEERLRSAATRARRVVLWCEHDSYDQLVLARCLAQFAETPPARLELISSARFPGAVRFIGLGQLPPEALRLLWEERRPVSSESLQTGRAVWAMLRAPDPRPLAAWAQTGEAGLPHLARAVQRHLQELPWTGDGLSLTERLILQLLTERPQTAGEAFSQLMQQREPLPWMSDLIFLCIVQGMQRAGQPVLDGLHDDEDQDWPKRRLTITPSGRSVLAGKADYLSLRPQPRWLGGVLLPDAAPCWRWEPSTAGVVER